MQDNALSRMRVHEYKDAISPKVLGTQNLVSALNHITFDFFVMLSSCNAILGAPGQANYAAGNTYQDTIACDGFRRNAHYISINLPPVEGTRIMSKEARQFTNRAGALTMRMHDVLHIIEYCISSKAREDDCRQLAFGFSQESISGSSQRLNPLFSHLAPPVERGTSDSSLNIDINIKDALDTSTSINEASNTIAQALSRKVSTLVSLGYEKVSVDYPTKKLGLDSLVTIELKRWIAQTFQATVQNSEIMDSGDMLGLGEMIANRSGLLKIQLGTTSHQGKQKASGQVKKSPTLVKLEPIPLPQLEETMNGFVDSVSGLYPPDDMPTLLSAAKQFLEPDGQGQELHQRLVARTKDPRLDWLYDLYVADIWTKRRAAVNPWRHFFSVLSDYGIKHSQARRAAIVSAAALRYKQEIETERLDQEYRDGEPLNMDLYYWIFNAYLEPHINNDTIHRAEERTNNFIVLRNGHVFEIDGHSSVDYLEAQFQGVLDKSSEAIPAVASLTADERDSWAHVRRT